MRALRQKLIRDLKGSLGILGTVVAIIGVGTGSLIGLASAQRILEASQRSYYRQYRFADFWVDVKKVPLSTVQRLASIRGVSKIEGRVVFDVILDVPGEIRPIAGRLISVPARRLDRVLNGICIVRGSGFSDDRDEEVILSDSFAEAHGLDIGDRIEVILNRKKQSFVIVGTAISPEYVYMVRGEGDIIPDPKHFGILYIKDRYAHEALDFKDSCNQIVGRLVPGAEKDVDLLLEEMERKLEPYGVLAKTPRERQASHRFLSDEIRGLGISASIMPAIFCGVAALVLNILMTRQAERQRAIIGTLKALGYSSREVLGHFLSFGLVVGVVGGVAGTALGVGVALSLIWAYTALFFQFPTFAYETYPDLIVVGFAISILFALAGTAKGVWSVLKLQPAEAMRERPPERGGAIFLERLPRLWRSFDFRTQIALRSVVRNRIRTITGVISSALAMSIIFLSLALFDSMYYLVDFQFERVIRSDIDLGMRDEKPPAALFEVKRLPGVDYAEPVLAVGCELRNGRRGRRLGVLGLSRRHELTTPIEKDLTPIEIPPDGLVLSRKLAEVLAVDVGDSLELTPIRGRRDTKRVHVASLAEGFFGLECYGSRDYLSRIVGEASAINSLQLVVNPAEAPALYRAIKELPNAQGLAVSSDARAIIEDTLIETSVFSLGLMIMFAGLIAFGAMLNSSLVDISERIREVSTFRVFGYHPAQIAGIFLRQNLVTFALGAVLAAPLGYGMVVGTAALYDTELFRMPVVISPMTIAKSILLASVFVLVAQLLVYRHICRVDWVEGVKVKE